MQDDLVLSKSKALGYEVVEVSEHRYSRNLLVSSQNTPEEIVMVAEKYLEMIKQRL